MSWKEKLMIIGFLFWGTLLMAGPYAPKAGESGSTAVSKDNSGIVAWATGWENMTYGTNVDNEWKTPENAIGASSGSSTDVVALGRGGTITLTFAKPIKNGDGWDFAVFENSFDGEFLELAYVEVSSNGVDFVRFDNHSQVSSPVAEFGTIDATEVDGLAGKYQIGYGTPFDLQDLSDKSAVISSVLNLSAVTHVRIVDIIGDGTYKDTSDEIIYDPYPSNGSAGFDLEATAVRYQNSSTSNTAPVAPVLNSPPDQSVDISLITEINTNSFSDPDTNDSHLLTQWQISTNTSFPAESIVFNTTTSSHLTAFVIPPSVLEIETNYFWRARFYDAGSMISAWSTPFEFRTTDTSSNVETSTMDWDGDGVSDTDIKSISATNSDGDSVKLGFKLKENISKIDAINLLDISTTGSTGKPDSLPNGLVSFRLTTVDTDNTAELVIYLASAAHNDAKWYQYDTIRGWREYDNATFNSARTQLTLQLKDGLNASGDIDGVQNGIIISSGGIGLNSSSSDSEQDDDAGISSTAGCFISTVEPASYNGWLIGILGFVSAVFLALVAIEI